MVATTRSFPNVGCTEPKANCTDPAFDGAVRLRLSAPYAISGGSQIFRFFHPEGSPRVKEFFRGALTEQQKKSLLRGGLKIPS
jgi:hypothetical protein